jgi:hypothetical protein
MRRLPLPALVGLVVLLGTASSARAFYPKTYHHGHSHWYAQPMAPVAPLVPMAPVAPVAPISPQQILGWVQLGQQVGHVLVDALGRPLDTRQQQPPARQPAPERPISPEVFTSLEASRKNLASAVKGTNALMEMVKTGDSRVADLYKDKKPISMKDKAPAKGSSSSSSSSSGSSVSPGSFDATDPKGKN